MEALVEHRGKQFLVKENLEIKMPYLGGKTGDKVDLDKILYIDDSKKKEFGQPYIKSLSITGKILSHGRDDKIIVFKMKRRKGYQVKNGHRQNFTLVKIEKFKKATSKKTESTKASENVKKDTTKAKKTTTKKTASSKKTADTKKDK
tara:strand:+ start:237 stop:677 length:441 start_codon:yes stop_codon:yes gene_type:complete